MKVDPFLRLVNSSTPSVVGMMAAGFITSLCCTQFHLCATALYNCLLKENFGRFNHAASLLKLLLACQY